MAVNIRSCQKTPGSGSNQPLRCARDGTEDRMETKRMRPNQFKTVDKYGVTVTLLFAAAGVVLLLYNFLKYVFA